MKKIIVIGGGGHAKVVIGILKKTGLYRILGYTDPADRGDVLGVKCLGGDNVLAALVRERPRPAAVLGIGSVLVSGARKARFEKLEALGFDLPAIVSPAAIVNEGVDIGKGTVVCDGVIINPGTKIGKGAILNTNCSVDHDCEIGDFAHLAPGVTLSGGVSIGANCLIGTGANIIQNVSIVAHTTIGAGATVIENIREAGTYVGLPAKKKK